MAKLTPAVVLFGIVFSLVVISSLSGCADESSAPAAETRTRGADATQAVGESSPDEMFAQRCAACHDNVDNKRAPDPRALAKLSGARIAFTLINGTMKAHAEGLDQIEVFELAQHLSAAGDPYQPAESSLCAETSSSTVPVVRKWGIDAHNTASLPPGASSITTKNVNQLQLAWAFGLPETSDTRSQPVVTEDTLFIASTGGHLFALDRFSGCIRWHRAPDVAPRTSLTMGTLSTGENMLFFGDVDAHTVAMNPLTGEIIWRVDTRVTEHTILTGAPIQHGNRLIVPASIYEVALAADPEYECCISHGGVVALDAGTGQRLWTMETTPPAQPRELSSVGTQNWGPSGAPVWSTPTIDAKRNLVYVGTGQNASQPATDLSDSVIALDLDTGALVWHFQAIAGDAYNMACDMRPAGPNCPKWRGPDHDIGASVIIAADSNGKDVLLVGQKSGDVYALDPDADGEMLWQKKVGAGSALGGIHWGMALANGALYVPVSDPPFPLPGYYPKPGLYALDVDDGDEIWASPVERGCDANVFEYFSRTELYPQCSFFYGLSAAPLVANDLVFAPALDGKLRAFDAQSGHVVWSQDTATSFQTVNGVEGHGGAIDVAGVTAAGGMVYVQSGYSLFGQLPGNLLLAYAIR